MQTTHPPEASAGVGSGGGLGYGRPIDHATGLYHTCGRRGTRSMPAAARPVTAALRIRRSDRACGPASSLRGIADAALGVSVGRGRVQNLRPYNTTPAAEWEATTDVVHGVNRSTDQRASGPMEEPASMGWQFAPSSPDSLVTDDPQPDALRLHAGEDLRALTQADRGTSNAIDRFVERLQHRSDFARARPTFAVADRSQGRCRDDLVEFRLVFESSPRERRGFFRRRAKKSQHVRPLHVRDILIARAAACEEARATRVLPKAAQGASRATAHRGP